MLQKVSLFVVAAFLCITVRAQYTVKLVLDAIPPKHPDDAMYLMGEYNQWTPNDPNSQFVKDATGKWTMTAENVPANMYEIKVTRGTKETVECMGDGKPMDNRKVTVNSDTTFHLTVAGWTDDFPKQTTYLNRKVVPSSAR
ncbi:hypothetical protein [Dinghuibacter silviterrae]|uniref:hypothetical protein n=1 Tax=Dinghuibacter silviterrae TaxID=1539049 RepID=UPI001063BE88|nr:hypothetical protein [Dinghuibacter silviterrae]